MSSNYLPSHFNKLGIAHLMQHPAASLFAKPGAGKTAMTLTALLGLDALDDTAFPVLVVASVRIARAVWDAEVRKWTHTRHLRVSKILGTPAQRRAALATPADIYTINIENADWLEKELKGQLPFRTLVMDESSKLKGCRAQIKTVKGTRFFARGGTKNASAVVKMGLKAKRRINLTGTPSANGLQNLWPQQFFLDYGNTLGTNFGAFESRWFRNVGPLGEAQKMVPMPHAFDEITARIAPTTLSLDPKNHVAIKDVRVVDVPVELPPAARDVYRTAKKDLIIQQSGNTISIVNAGVLTNKLSQIASGFVYDADKNFHYLHDAKLDALDDVLDELDGHPVIVAYHYKAELSRLKLRYPQARELPKGAGQQAVEDAWNRGDIPMLLIHPASAGHGLNLQDGGCDIVIINPTWDLELYQQVIERIGPVRQMQSGYHRQVSVYRIYTKNTVDVQVLTVLDQKASLQDAVMETVRHGH